MLTEEQIVKNIAEREKEIETSLKKGAIGIRIEEIKQIPKERTASIKIGSTKKKISSVLKKAIHLVAPKGSTVERWTGSSDKQKKKGRGRGRPRKSYKSRFVPGVGVVKVPTHIYKKMMSKARADERLAQAQRMAMAQAQANQIASSQDPRYQAGPEDQFLAETDQIHEAQVMRAQQQAEMEQYAPQQPSTFTKGVGMVKRFAGGLSAMGGALGRFGAPLGRPMAYDQFGRQVNPQERRIGPISGGLKGEPRVSAIGGKANLLLVPNQFNKSKRRNQNATRR